MKEFLFYLTNTCFENDRIFFGGRVYVTIFHNTEDENVVYRR